MSRTTAVFRIKVDAAVYQTSFHIEHSFTETNLKQLANLLYAQANSASYLIWSGNE